MRVGFESGNVEAGRIIGGKYRLRRQVGEGGMGAVWSAVHETLDRTVAIKFLRTTGGADAETASARFVSEARSAARVKHRFVVDVFDFGITEDGISYMVQELLEGEELADCMDHGPAWQVRDVVSFVAHCLSGLESVHQAGIVHRDLKPENIFVMRDSDGRTPKLLDFGISKLSHSSSPSMHPGKTGRVKQLTSQGMTVGTPLYMSPEQLRGRKELDGRADIYSMGVILYEWLTGRVPYEEDNVAELSLKVASGSAIPLISLRPEIGHGLSSVVAKALAPEANERFATATEFREALLALVPTLPEAWAIVQKSSRGQPISPRTDLLLASAHSPFGDEERDLPTGLISFGARRIRPWMIATGAALLAGLVCLPFFLHSRPGRANAAPESVQTAHPVPAEKPAVKTVPEPAKEEPTPVVQELVPAQRVQPKAAPEPAESSTHRSTHKSSTARGDSRRSKDARGTRKVIHTLDF